MSMRQTEYPNNTREQVAEYLQTAADIVAELDIAPDLIPHAFVQAVNLVAAKQVVLEQVGLGMAIPRGDGH
jgi:transcriptional regulator GlxA family with amidase domain